MLGKFKKPSTEPSTVESEKLNPITEMSEREIQEILNGSEQPKFL